MTLRPSDRRARVLRVAILLATCACASACDDERRPSAAVVSYCGANAAEIETRIDRLLVSLTRERKARLTRGDGLAELTSGISAWQVDGLPDAGVPPLRMIDGPRGVAFQAGSATAFPVAIARGATFDPSLEERVGEAIGRETRAKGIDVILAPTMNVLRHPRWGRAQETYGEDPLHMAKLAGAFVEGAQRHVLATAKHYAGNSIEDTRLTVDVGLDERTLREVYLPHFEHVVKQSRVASVMTAYNSVNGAYCSENDHLLREILKDEWGFSGLVMSDWVFGTHDTVAAARAGLDLEMPTGEIYGESLLYAVDDGRVPPAVLDDMVRRRLRAAFCHRLDVDPPVVDAAEVESAASLALAREVAERSLVLLRNTDAALPLPRTAGTEIVLTGALADVENIGDTGSSRVLPSSVVTVLEGLGASAGAATITHLPGSPVDSTSLSTMGAADAVVVVVGLTSADEGEALLGAGDRESLGLRAEDLAFLHSVAAVSNRVVVVLEGGSAITMDDFLGEVEGIVFAFYPGALGGSAIARVLFGDVNPSGRLPIVFPRAEADLPPFDNVSARVTYGYFHGYRHLDVTRTAPLFPFGFGLSYTTFVHSGLALSETNLTPDDVLHVSVDVTNAGPSAGRETVQVYVGPTSTKVTPRFVRDLRGFAQVELAPGETKTVDVEVPIASLGYWDTNAHAFVVEETSYLVEAGSSSRDLPLAATITVAR